MLCILSQKSGWMNIQENNSVYVYFKLTAGNSGDLSKSNLLLPLFTHLINFIVLLSSWSFPFARAKFSFVLLACYQ